MWQRVAFPPTVCHKPFPVTCDTPKPIFHKRLLGSFWIAKYSDLQPSVTPGSLGLWRTLGLYSRRGSWPTALLWASPELVALVSHTLLDKWVGGEAMESFWHSLMAGTTVTTAGSFPAAALGLVWGWGWGNTGEEYGIQCGGSLSSHNNSEHTHSPEGWPCCW